MSLGLNIELRDIFAIVNFFSVYFLIAQYYTFPNSFICLLKVDIQELCIFNRPKTVVCLYFFTQFSINNWLCLSLYQYFQMFWFDLNNHLLRCGSFRQRNLHVNVFNRLTPVVLFCLRTVVSAYFLVHFHFLLVWSWNFVLLQGITLVFLNTFCLLRNLHNLWLIF